MSVKMKVTFTPIDEYFFGGEQNAGFGVDKRAPYFIRSENIPTQTTILGVFRYSSLENNNLLTPNFDQGNRVDGNHKEEQEALVGKSSFSFAALTEQSFGHIKKISPVFLEENGDLYSRHPLNYRVGDDHTDVWQYEMFKMKKSSSEVDEKSFWLPENYKAKNGLPNAWIHPNEKKKLVHDTKVFLGKEKVGIIKLKKEKEDSGFFKKEYKGLRKGWHFTCFVNVESETDLPKEKIVRMGQSKSLFYMECKKTEMVWEDVIARINLGRVDGDSYHGVIYYAISDCYPNCPAEKLYQICDFAVTQVRPFRSLETKRAVDRYYDVMKKTNKVALLRSGSVFYVPENRKNEFENLFADTHRKIGFNRLLREEDNNESSII